MVKASKSYSKKQSIKLSAIIKAITTLQEQMDTFVHNQNAEENRQKKAKENHKIIKTQDLIPRPKGRPGRSNEKRGYKVIDAMGLSKKKKYFNFLQRAIRKLANRKLDTSRTLTQQKNGSMVEKVISQARLKYKIFQKYENAWPARDMLAQYLRSSSQQKKKAAKKFEHRNGKLTVEGISISDEESSNEDSSENMGGSVSRVDSSFSDLDGTNEESDVSLEGRSEDLRADSDSGSDENPRSTKSKTAKILARSSGKNNSHPQKRCKNQSEDMHADSDSGSDEGRRPTKSRTKETLARSSGKHDSHPQKRREDELEDRRVDSDGSDEDPRPTKSKTTKTLARSSGKHDSHSQKRRKDEPEDRRVDSDGSDEDPRPTKSKTTKTLARSSGKYNLRPRKRHKNQSEDRHIDSDASDEDPRPSEIKPTTSKQRVAFVAFQF
ncbi:hypothetical protein EV401DRAFT_2068316 [Pisolithus croceorrhizus]|nr:hypothetical protein EV401DRAFT_2068316 [Pisolithus croceorrhizus]